MRISQSGIELLKRFEGLELEAYQDIAGVWTIGYGHTGADVKPNMRISEREAEALLKRDLRPREDAVDSAVRASLNQNEFDALVSFVYNVGVNAFRGSTALKRLNRGDLMGAADALTWWNKATVNGVLRAVTGLTRRRAAERALFLTPTNPPLVAKPEELNENTRITPVEDPPRRSNPAESRTVQGATVAGGAGVAASTMGRDTAEELDQIETNIESGESMIENADAHEGSSPPAGAMPDDDAPDTPDEHDHDPGESDPGADDTDDDAPDSDIEGRDIEVCDGQDDAALERDEPVSDEPADEGPGDEAAANGACDEAAPEEDTDISQGGVTADVDEDGQVTLNDSFREEGVVVGMSREYPSKHEAHAVEAQVQFALLILIILSVLFVIYARIEDWWNFRR